MNWLAVAFVSTTIGTLLILITPLGRLLGLYGPTRLVESGWILGMYGRPTARFWALFALQFAVASAWNFSTGSTVLGALWAVFAVVNVAHALRESSARRSGGDGTGSDGGAAS